MCYNEIGKWGGMRVSKKSDENLIDELFAEYRQMMLKIALGVLHNKHDAEDAVQDAFLWIINNLEKISQIPCYERAGYFATIIEHRSIDIYRKRTGHAIEDIEEQYDLSSDECVEEAALSSVTVNEIKKAMNELLDRDYEILYLHLFKEMSSKEISAVTGISENSVRVYIQRARKRFAKILHKRGVNYDI